MDYEAFSAMIITVTLTMKNVAKIKYRKREQEKYICLNYIFIFDGVLQI